MIWCLKCGRPVEPTEEAIKTQICGICRGLIDKGVKVCFDGSPCTEPHQDCNKCKWMGRNDSRRE